MSANGNGRRPHGGNGNARLTEELIATMVLAVKAGTPLRWVGPYAGVNERTFFMWMAHGRNGGKPLEKKLVKDIDEAEAQRVVTALSGVATAGDWRADAWWLERRYPQEFGRRDHVTTEGTVEHTVKLDLSKLDEDDLAALERLHRKALEADDGPKAPLLQLPPGTAAGE